MRPITRLVGYVLIGVGLLFLLRNFGVVPALSVNLVRWWPGVLVAIGIGMIVHALRHVSRAEAFMPGVILLIYGAFLLLVPLGIIRASDIGHYWGVFPAAIGAVLLTRAVLDPGRHRRSLTPAIALLAAGAWGFVDNIAPGAWRVWPVILIVFGVFVITRGCR